MAWIYFRELVGSSSLSDDGLEPSPIAKSINTARACYCPACNRVTLAKLPSGTMCELSNENCSQKSTSSMEASHARTLALLEMERAWKESEADFTLNSGDSLAIYDPVTCSWKTSQLSLFEDLNRLLWTSLRWGMIRDGRMYQPPKLAPVTGETVGSCLPTPRANDSEKRGDFDITNPRNGLPAAARTLPTPMARDYKNAGGSNRNSLDLPRSVGGNLNPQFVEEIMGYRIAWTESEPSVIQWFLTKRGRRSCG